MARRAPVREMTADTRRLEEADPDHSLHPSPIASVSPRLLDDPERTVADVLARALEATPTAAELGSSVLDAVGVAMYVTDRDGHITFYNEAAVQLWGRRPALGELWCGSLRLFHPDGSPMAHGDCPMAVALKEERPVRDQEALLEQPDGTRVWFRPYPTPIRDASGRMTGAVNVLIDLTELRRTEEALRTSAAELAASNAVKDEFLGLVSHELRTPITTVLGNAQLLSDKGDAIPEEIRAAMLGDIAAESERLLGIVENLLLLTRLDAGHHPDPEPQVLAHVVRTTVEAFHRHHPSRDVQLQQEPRHLIVEADRPLLELLIENLISNANKYSPETETIEIDLRATEDEAIVRVLDRGIGLQEIDADRLFTPFYRSPTAKATTSGIGIGLAACRRVVEALGGRIWAAPRPDGGSEFGFSLPLAGVSGDPSPA
jgi:two-component system, chemotaxis family, CheB/CheR fusion protein